MALAGLDLRMPPDAQGRRSGYQGVLIPVRDQAAGPGIPLPQVVWSYGAENGQLSAISSGGRAVSFAHSATADAETRTLARSHAAAAGLPLTTTEVSSQAQSMFSINHTSSGFDQSRSLGPVIPPGQTLSCRIDCTDPDFGMGGDAARSRWLYGYDSHGQITNSSKQTVWADPLCEYQRVR